MDKSRKILSIVLISLLIISTVFTLCKKVGLCASEDISNNNVSDFPLNCNGLIGFNNDSFFNDNLKERILDLTYFPNSTYKDYYRIIKMTEYSSNNYILFKVYFVYPGSSHYFFQYSNNPTFSTSAPSINVEAKYIDVHYSFSNDTLSITYNNLGSSSRTYEIVLFSVALQSNPDNTFSYRDGFFAYPLYIDSNLLNTPLYYGSSISNLSAYSNSAFISVTDNDNGGSLGHSKGGVLGNYVDSSDFLEDSSEIPPLNLPSTATDFQSLWDNIKAFFERSFSNFNAWLLTMGDYLGQILEYLQTFYEGVTDFFTSVFDTLFGWLSDIFDNTDNISENTDDLVTDVHGHYQWSLGYWTESGSSNTTFWDYFDDHINDWSENIWGHLPSTIKDGFRFFKALYDFGVFDGEFSISYFFERIFSIDVESIDDAWVDEWEDSDIYTLVTHFQSMHSGLLSIINVSPAESLSFTIDMYPISIPNLNGGSDSVYLFGRSVTLDFSWYKSALFGGRSIQDMVLSILLPFLYVGFILSLFLKSPGIISGVSGFVSNVKEITSRGEVTSTMIQTKKINPSTRIVWSRKL